MDDSEISNTGGLPLSKIRHRGGSECLKKAWIKASGRNIVILSNARNEEGKVIKRCMLIKGREGFWAWLAQTNLGSFSLQLQKKQWEGWANL